MRRLRSGVFEPLRGPSFFAQAKVNEELGTVCWPNDADLDSDVLPPRARGHADASKVTAALR
jgi:hypothetical protein